MKNRIICILLVCVLLIGLLTACGKKKLNAKETETVTTETKEQTEEVTTEEPTTEAPETEEETEAETEAASDSMQQSSTSSSSSSSSSSSLSTPPAASEDPTQAPVVDATEPVDKRAVAMGYIGSSVGSLYAAIGYPNDSSYASSCNGPGEDGELYYDGFTVYTFRENGVETVTDVW